MLVKLMTAQFLDMANRQDVLAIFPCIQQLDRSPIAGRGCRKCNAKKQQAAHTLVNRMKECILAAPSQARRDLKQLLGAGKLRFEVRTGNKIRQVTF